MANDFVFPEDEGTGAAGGDNADAANFATLAFRGEHRNNQVVPITLTPDFNNNELDTGPGLAVTSEDSADEAQSNETRDQGVRYAAIIDSRTALSIGTDDKEAVWLDIDLSTDDTINIVVQKEGDTAPTKPRLKLAVVDNLNEVAYTVNTEPETRGKTNAVRNSVREGESGTVPEGLTQIVTADYEVEGEIDVQGKLQSVSDHPTPKRHDHRGNKLIPSLSAPKTVIESWETFRVPEDNGFVTPGPFEIYGDFTVDGEMLSFDSISGTTSISGSGRVRVKE